MSKKTKNRNKQLLAKIHKQAEDFSRGEEIANFVSHTVGAGLASIAFIILIIRASWTRDGGTIIAEGKPEEIFVNSQNQRLQNFLKRYSESETEIYSI